EKLMSSDPSDAAIAARAATTTIPIVFIAGENPVTIGLVGSLARPSGNLTGINFFVTELAAKRLELLRELVPSTKRIAGLVDPSNNGAGGRIQPAAKPGWAASPIHG